MKEPYDDIVPRLEAHANDADNSKNEMIRILRADVERLARDVENLIVADVGC